ncbi:MAG: hypothetical protein DWQ07_08440 [Chloroflexi bacterium]|nr:MAG: hypothetical protein DWQ07_08440 [Chloroflexota bacterium]MBL1193260.1 hypothetical protein [Chloroflexota bacterium]NOH10553.1 hypothetical protein [Chloroflexota bacterium]
MKNLLIILGVLVVGIPLLGWIGLQIRPKAFDPVPVQGQVTQTMPLPEGLPAPVERFYRTVYGEEIPVIESAVVSGRAELRFMGITFPSRFRFTHVTGQDYRHYIEATIFGFPLMKVNEHYLDGHSRLALPFGVVENEPKIDQAANLGLWGEGFWFPAIYITDSRVRWAAIDDTSARMYVPFGEGEDEFVVTFDSETDLIISLDAMRYKEVTDEAKTPWHNEALYWAELDGGFLPTTGTVTWMDEGSPWATFIVEEVVYNANVSDYVRATGP